MTPDEAAIEGFLAECGWAVAEQSVLAGDASSRRYRRLTAGDGRRRILMIAPADSPIGDFLTIAGMLRAGGFSAPEVEAADPTAGLALIEDLGDDLLARAVDGGAPADALYGAACDIAAAFDRVPGADTLPAFDPAHLVALVDPFVSDYLPATGFRGDPEATLAGYRDLWRDLAPLADTLPRRFLHRDFHAENLLWLPDRAGLRRVGLLDFQDARFGPPAYDLVSLLRDARRDVDPTMAERLLKIYATATGLNRSALETSFALLVVHRQARILGIFARLARLSGKTRYLVHIPRLWRHIEAALGHPALQPLATWYDAHVPAPRRGVLTEDAFVGE
ncbi:aminoglycoside phosphotransferase family protein [Oceanibacterium hippocampi]|uniref:Phosphotransferase enzyme family protein n=1 Tax=Oceanibacterium hippocampi TaxID=745714 RepID=A0A1Y5RQS7_9PROT|nr:phosphotransferase [Oceanibacterium hippocampi]SLN22170.1 Phosphotransferase enzyme family protein [Oceanibacterium hippocampi]